MAKLKVIYLKKVQAFLAKSNKKYLSFDDLCRGVGVYSDVLGPELSYFMPMILMDSSLNMRDLEPLISVYLADQEGGNANAPAAPRVIATKKEMEEYPTIGDFVYRKMTGVSGLVDRTCVLSDHDLHLLEKIVQREVALRKKAEKRAKKKRRNK